MFFLDAVNPNTLLNKYKSFLFIPERSEDRGILR